jgi:hypothetical protein
VGAAGQFELIEGAAGRADGLDGGDPDGGGDRAERVARLRSLVDRTRPVALAEQRVLPVLPAIAELLPGQGLRRGATFQVSGEVGATSMALALAAGPTQAGSWAACVGLPELGWAAAAEAGVALDHLAVVRTPAPSWASVTAALVDAFDVVLCGLDHAPSAAEARRLTARARERGAVLVVVGGRTAGAGPARRAWPGVADVELTVRASEWSGIGAGRGRLVHRRLSLQVSGRRGADRPRRADLWFPGPSGIELVRDDLAAPGTTSAATAGPHLRRVG